jgi:hypothetical protein
LRAAKIQLAGLMRRRGTTRQEEQMLKKIQIEQLKLRIENMETTEQETVEMYDTYLEKKKIIDDYLTKAGEETYQLKYQYDQQYQDLSNHIAEEKVALDLRYEWWDSTNSEIIESSKFMIRELERIMADSELNRLFAEWGVDLDELLAKINSILAATSTSKTAAGKATAIPGAVMVGQNVVLPGTTAYKQATYLETLKNIGGFPRGTHYVPETDIYKLHRGETVIPAGKEGGAAGDTFQITINIPSVKVESDYDVERLASALGLAMERRLLDSTGKTRFRRF